ncbi:Uncharacterised protein [Mycolicibacterium flavescens]|nr:Uncharacterised protein [Mycolicibacterium flavescens]
MQRTVLKRLRANTADPMCDWDNDFASWTSITELAGSIDRTRVESTRRAVLKLEAAGLVDTLIVWREVDYWYPRWLRPSKTSRQMLVARIRIDGDIRERWTQRWEDERRRVTEAIDRLVALDRGIS